MPINNKSNALRLDGGSVPLLNQPLSGTVAWRGDKPVDGHRFLSDVVTISTQLPERSCYAVNICEDRYWFLVTFVAVLLRDQTNLLPPNRSAAVIKELTDNYPGSYCVSEKALPGFDRPSCIIDQGQTDHVLTDVSLPSIQESHMAAIAFTSGSTGKPSPNPKTWGELVLGEKMMSEYFRFVAGEQSDAIVATVPSQHMYGLETTVLNALVNGVSIYCGETFYPSDIHRALSTTGPGTVLVTTPVHLRACLDSELEWPEVKYIISATAVLDAALAQRAESKFRCPVYEIYGCTETGSLASRQTTKGQHWQLYSNLKLHNKQTESSVSGDKLAKEVELQDIIEIISDRKFVLKGRKTDLVNIAGKRESLDGLNAKLQGIEGVQDAAFIAPRKDDVGSYRLAALVVAPNLTKETILKELKKKIDAVFLPRPLRLVDSLPRNDTGKLPRDELLKLLGSSSPA